MKPIYKSVYVAASSDEQSRARAVIELLKSSNIPCTSNWIETIAEVGGNANPRGDEAFNTRLHAVAECKMAIRKSDVLWFLVPMISPGRGGYYEAGYADAIGRRLVFSGDTHQSVFCSQGDEFADDMNAFEHIKKLAVT